MNKQNNFNIFVGIAIISICIVVVLLALMSALVKNENANNVIYIEDSSKTTLDMPKSNVVTEYINLEKTISNDKYNLELKVRLPRININTAEANKLNSEIYSVYSSIYEYASNITSSQKLEISYSYEFTKNDKKLEILITKKKLINDESETVVTKYIYDIVHDKYEVKEVKNV